MMKTLAILVGIGAATAACASGPSRDIGEHRIAWQHVTIQHCGQGICEPLTLTVGNVMQLNGQRRAAVLQGGAPDFNEQSVTVLCADDAVYNDHVEQDVAEAVCHANLSDPGYAFPGYGQTLPQPPQPPVVFTVVGANGEYEAATSEHVTYEGCLREAGRMNQAIRQLGGRQDYPVRCVRFASAGGQDY